MTHSAVTDMFCLSNEMISIIVTRNVETDENEHYLI